MTPQEYVVFCAAVMDAHVLEPVGRVDDCLIQLCRRCPTYPDTGRRVIDASRVRDWCLLMLDEPELLPKDRLLILELLAEESL